MVDLGSGALVSADELRAAGVPAEPGVRETVATGVDVVCFSGDKLLGGPQAGILVGRADAVARCRQHPLMRAVRPDKLTLAALEATLALYRDQRVADIPALAMLAAAPAALRARVEALTAALAHPAVTAVPCSSTVGGGAMPLSELPSWGLAIAGPAGAIDGALRAAPVPVVGRVVDGRVIADLRTVQIVDEPDLVAAVRAAVAPPVASGPGSV
jgi:L-seryl-tRNA(Ser) seleniumtransferase